MGNRDVHGRDGVRVVTEVQTTGSDLLVTVARGMPAGVMGASSWPERGPMIVLADDLTVSERRTTVAHELAHLLFDAPRRPDDATAEEREERAERFAVELLTLLGVEASS